MLSLTLKLYDSWKHHLSQDCPQDYQSICTWLLSCPSDRLHRRSVYDINQRINYRYRILQKRYLGKSQKDAYHRLINRLLVIVSQHPLIPSQLKGETSLKSLLIDLIEQILTHLITHNLEIQKTIDHIGKCTPNADLREALLLASLEEYCCQLVNGQPMIIHDLRQLLTPYKTL